MAVKTFLFPKAEKSVVFFPLVPFLGNGASANPALTNLLHEIRKKMGGKGHKCKLGKWDKGNAAAGCLDRPDGPERTW